MCLASYIASDGDINDCPRVVLGLNSTAAQRCRRPLLHGLNSDLAGLRVDEVFRTCWAYKEASFVADQGRECATSEISAPQLANVGTDIRSNKKSDKSVGRVSSSARLYLQDRAFVSRIWRWIIGDEDQFEAAAQTVFDPPHSRGKSRASRSAS